MAADINEVSGAVIGAAIAVHRALGPGLLESVYQKCLRHELTLRGVPVECEVNVPVCYKGITIDCGYRLDMLVKKQVVVELKAVETIHPLHEAQLMSYLRLGGWQVGLLINFNVPILRDGIRRVVMGLKEKKVI
jgi:GxxExxY protein